MKDTDKYKDTVHSAIENQVFGEAKNVEFYCFSSVDKRAIEE